MSYTKTTWVDEVLVDDPLYNITKAAATVTISIGTPAVITWAGHGLNVGDAVIFATTGALPTGLTAGTHYYVIAAGLTVNAFEVSTSINGAAVNTSGTQSGTQTAQEVISDAEIALSTSVATAGTALTAAAMNNIEDTIETIDATLTAGVGKVLLNAAPANDGYSGTVISLTATANLTLGKVGFIASTGKVTMGDADALATAGVVVMATAAIATDAAGIFLVNGTIHLHTLAPGWTIGGLIYLDPAAGAMSQTPPSGANDVIQILGVALAADVMLFNPSLIMVEHV